MHIQPIQFLSQRQRQRLSRPRLLLTPLGDPRHALDHPRLAHEALVQFRWESCNDAVVVAPFPEIAIAVGFAFGRCCYGGGGSAPEMFGGVREEVGG